MYQFITESYFIKQLLVLFYQYLGLVILEVIYSPHLRFSEYCTSRKTKSLYGPQKQQ